MQALWNKMQLERPPNATWRTEANKCDTRALLSTLDKTITELESQNILHSEATILSRLIYRMKCKFRNDKGLKGMEKVNRALLNYLSLAIWKEYKNLRSYIEIDGKHVTFPSKQMVEYVLVRTQGFAKLMARIEEVATQSANYFKNRISVGHAWTISLIAYAVVSRIWILSRHLVKRCCSWYNSLYHCSEKLKIVGLPWLAKGQELPYDLKLWLGLPWIDQEITRAPTEKYLQDNMFKLLQLKKFDSDDEPACDDDDESESLHLPDTSKKNSDDNSKSAVLITGSHELSNNADDIGEFINRNTFKRNYPTEKYQRKTIPVKKQKVSEHVVLSRNERNTVIPSPDQIIPSNDVINKSVDSNNKISDSPAKKVNKKQKATSKKMIKDFNGADETIGKPLDLDKITSKSDLVSFLNKDSHEGLDKLQWNIIKKNAMKFVTKIDKCVDQKKQVLLVRKAIRSIKDWIN